MHKNALGTIVEECIKAIPEHHPQVTIHNYVIMPNHIHLIIATVGTRYIASATAKLATAKYRNNKTNKPTKTIHRLSKTTRTWRANN